MYISVGIGKYIPMRGSLSKLLSDCAVQQVLGINGQWKEGGKVELLHLSTPTGYCVIFRLYCMQTIPQCLRKLLEDKNILKIGNEPLKLAQRLQRNYGVVVRNTLDLRFPAVINGYTPDPDVYHMYNIIMDDEPRRINANIIRSDWHNYPLIIEQIAEATECAVASSLIFNKLVGRLNNSARVMLRLCFDKYFDHQLHRQLPRLGQLINI